MLSPPWDDGAGTVGVSDPHTPAFPLRENAKSLTVCSHRWGRAGENGVSWLKGICSCNSSPLFSPF